VLALAQDTPSYLPPVNVLLTEPRPALLTIGPADVHARAQAMFIYDDNISLYDRKPPPGYIQTDNQQPVGDDFIWVVAPGVTFTKAAALTDSRTALTVDYSPSFIFFTKNPQVNSIDHAAKLNAGYAFTKLTLGLTHNFDETSGGVVDVGSRVRQSNHRTAGSARYEMTEKTFLLVDATHSIRDYEELNDSREWSFTPTANYQLTPKVALGLGVRVGQLFVDRQAQVTYVREPTDTKPGKTNIVDKVVTEEQTYVGPTLRATYQTTEKISVGATLGGELRMYDDGSSSFGPIFQIDGTYQPWQGTRFTLGAHRREQNSAILNGQNYISTGASLTARQQLMERLSAHLTVTFYNADYKPAQRSVSTTRNDDYFLLRYGLDAILGRSWTIGVFHQYRDNVSSEETFSFSNNQVGIRAAWGY